jgi:hypothetical protein
MGRLVHFVADYGEGDVAWADAVQRVAVAVPDAVVQRTPVATADTLAAGFCVAQLALNEGPPDRIVVHDIAPAGDESGDDRFCTGRSTDGVLVVGPNVGWAWSFAVDGLHGLCLVDVPAAPHSPHARDYLSAALIHLLAHHPHAVCDDIPADRVRPVPNSVVAYVDGRGNVVTTLTEPPAPPGTEVTLRVGDAAVTVTVAESLATVPSGRLGLAPGDAGWPTRDGPRRRYLELAVPGGSAAQQLGDPPTGTPVVVQSS